MHEPAPDNAAAYEQFTRHWVKAQPTLATFISAVVVDANDAEDVLQNVALAASRDFGGYDPSRPFVPWVMAIARNRVVDHHRSRRKRGPVFSADTVAELASVCERTMPMHEEHDRLVALRACVKGLSERHREVLELRYSDDLSGEQIAQRKGMTVNAVFLALSRVRAQLADCITRRLGGTEGTERT